MYNNPLNIPFSFLHLEAKFPDQTKLVWFEAFTMTSQMTKINYLYLLQWFFAKNHEIMHTSLCICEYLQFSGVSFYVSPDSQKLYDPQVVTVLGFKLFHEIPTCLLWHKFYDVEPHKRQDWNFIWFHLLKIICGLQLLRNRACFQINHKPPCSFHPPQKSPECLWGAQARPLSLQI